MATAELDLIVRLRDEASRGISQLAGSLGTISMAGAAVGVAAVAGGIAAIGAAAIDAAGKAAEVERVLGELDDAELQNVTAQADYLAQSFGIDIAESARTADRVIADFGTTASGAFHILEQGQQRGLDRFGDLNDTLVEYGKDFADVGLSSSRTLALIETGLEAGFMNTDKIGDAMNEFGIRLRDVGQIEALGKINQDAANVVAAFQSGAITSEQAFDQIGEAIRNIEDPIQQNAALIQTFGTAAEDAGHEAALALVAPGEALREIGWAIDEGQREYQNFGQIWADVSSTAQAALIPLGQELLALATEAMPYVKSGIEQVASVLPPLVAAITPAVSIIGAMIGQLFSAQESMGGFGTQASAFQAQFSGVITSIQGLFTAFVGLFQAQIAAITAFWDQNGAAIIAKGQEIGALLIEIGALITQLVVGIAQPLIAQMTAFWQQHGDTVMATVGSFIEFTMGAITTGLELIAGILKATLQLIQGDWEGAWTTIQEFSAQFVLNLGELFMSGFEHIKNVVVLALAAIGIDLQSLVAAGQNAAQGFYNTFIAPILGWIDQVQAGFNRLQDFAAGIQDRLNNISIPEIDIPGFAGGGVIPGGQLALVGERGPELIMPANDTRVIPNDESMAMMRGGGQTVNITINQQPGEDSEQLAQRVAAALRRNQKGR